MAVSVLRLHVQPAISEPMVAIVINPARGTLAEQTRSVAAPYMAR